MCNLHDFFQPFDISMYDISSLKQLILADPAIHYNIYENLSKKFTNYASIVQVYSTYNFN